MTDADWRPTFARWLVSEVDRRAGTAGADLPLLSVSEYRGVVPRRSDGEGQQASLDLSDYKVCEEDDIVLNRLWAFRGGIGRSDTRGLVSPDYAVLRPTGEADSRFLHHLFRSTWFVGEMTARLRGIGTASTSNGRKPRLNVLDFGTIPVTIPPLDQQQRIADFLDAESRRIETATTIAEQQLSLAEEHLNAVAATVLRVDGRLPFTPLPGAVPRGYRPLWLAATTFSGKTLQQEQAFSHEVPTPYLKASNIGQESVMLDGLETMWASPAERAALQIEPGDVFVIEGGATAGKVAMLDSEPSQLTILQNHVHCVRAAVGFEQRYLYWVLRAFYSSGWYPTITSAVTFGSFPAGKLRALPVPDVSLGVQRQIASVLDEQLVGLAQLRERTGALKGLLTERKQALITAAVTGQITT